jgi:TonB family protein
MGTALSCDRPAYPLTAQARGMQGLGHFQLTIRPDGVVQSVKVTKSTGHPLLDQAGVAALRTWRFPRGAPSTLRVPIDWYMGTIQQYHATHHWRDPKSLTIGDGEWVIITSH